MPDYFIEYMNNNYQDIDPVVIHAMNRFSPLVWDDNLMINSKWKVRTIADLLGLHVIISGQTFILHDAENNLAVLSIYINKYINPDVYGEVSKNKDEIQGVLIHAHEMLHHLYHNAESKNNSVDELTTREGEILYWSSKGKTYPEIAFILDITVSTVKFHMAKVIKKLGVQNAKHAIRLCAELNIMPDSVKN